MASATERRLVEDMFARADVRIGGARPFDITVHDDRFFRRALKGGQLGIGESYMDGDWDCPEVDEMSARFIRAGLHKTSLENLRSMLYALKLRVSGIGRKGKAFEVGRHHYDLGNDLFRAMLDKRMIYSCAAWDGANSLDEAQEHKLDLICRRARLAPGQSVLEIGCGWGGFAKFAAERYGVSVVGVTVSVEQQALAQEACAGLPVEIRLCDYRDVTGSFDRVVSIAMLEAVGHRHYGAFMEVADRCLKADGVFFLHSIFGNEPVGAATAQWLNEYIFPNGELPSVGQILTAAEGRFVPEAMFHLDGDYVPTLAAWEENFRAAWPSLKSAYDERFFRMWIFYLSISRGIFLSRIAHVWHLVFTKEQAR